VNQEEVAGPEDVPATSYTDNPAIAVPPAPELTADRLAGDESEQHWRKDRENREGVNADIHDAIRDLGRTDRKTADSFRQNGRTDPQQDFEREKPALDPAPEKPHIEAEKGEALAPAAKTDRELWADRLRNLPPVSEQAQALQRQAEAQRPVSGGKAGVASDWSEATQRPSYKTEKSANSGKTRVRAALDAMREKLDSLAERLETAFARFRDRAADRPRSPIIDQRQNPQRAPQAQAKVEPVKKVRTDPPQALRQPPPEPEKPKVHKSAYDLLMEDVERMGQAGAKRSPDHAKGRDQLRDLLKDYGRSRGREWEP
jgi:hypothetical protein